MLAGDGSWPAGMHAWGASSHNTTVVGQPTHALVPIHPRLAGACWQDSGRRAVSASPLAVCCPPQTEGREATRSVYRHAVVL